MSSNNNTQSFVVALDAVGLRLDQYCFQQAADFSRSFFQQLIEAGHVKVQGKAMLKSGYKVREGDCIEISMFVPKTINLAPESVAFDVIFEHPDFLVINKPAGLAVHPAPTNPGEITLVNGLLHRYPEFLAFETKERPGIVHRLDKNTSGLLLVARTVQAAAIFSEMFKNRQIKKKYLALVEGHPDAKGSITFLIGRDLVHRHKMTHANPHGRSAETHFEVVQYFADQTLLSVTIITGRTHQIRVHATAIGHSVFGDATYGKASPLIGRQALHAHQCSFEYQGKQYHFEAPLAEDIRQVLERLKPLP